MTLTDMQNNNKIQLSLAALMFFAPLVQHLIKTSKIDLSDSDKEFIQSYIQYGYITLI